LIDANMPGMNGFEVAEAIHQDFELGSALTMMLTSSEQRAGVARCAQLGVSAYVTKPVKQSELFDLVAKAIGADAELPSPILAPEAGPERKLAPLRILLAEDSLVNQKLALAQLEPQGHAVVVANNGEEAIDRWSSGAFDLILMDVQMPKVDGLAATRAIRERERQSGRGSRIPIVAMTAHAMKGDREKCLESGMDAYLSKPVRVQELFDLLRQLMARRVEFAAAVPSLPPDAQLPAASSDGDPVLDWPVALRRSGLPEATLRDLAGLFLRQSDDLLTEINQALARGDARSLQRAAHTLNGSASIFSAAPIARAAMRLEELALTGDLSSVGPHYQELVRQIDRLKPVLRDFAEQTD
jgi:CheY-like chemotaxis protein